MSLLSELRYPTTRRAKIITAVLAVVFFWLLATLSIATLLLYRVVKPARSASDLDPSQLPGNPSVVDFTGPGGEDLDGWFFPGLRGAPTIILCHGYQSDRTEVLTLVAALQEHRFNVFLFDFSGHGRTGGTTTLGFREAEEVRSAIEVLAQRDDVDAKRFGVWGANMGGYAALSAATGEPRIRALVLDSVYANPLQLLQYQIDRSGMGVLPMVTTFAGLGYRILNFSYHSQPLLSQRVAALDQVPKLFIQARDQGQLAEITMQIFLASPEPRQQIIAQKAYAASLGEEEKRQYENAVVSFFLEHLHPDLPAGAVTRRPAR